MNGIAAGLVLAYILAILAGLAGWVLNIIDIIAALGGPITAMFVARCVGTFVFPLGAVLGYF